MMTFLAILVGALIAVIVGVVLYVLNRQNRFE
jgi:ABC-type methionine transport system permease subunit